jgi:hypothetical protein
MLTQVEGEFLEEVGAMDGLDGELLARMRLAEAVLVVWKHIVDEDHLNEVFEQYRGRSYEQGISFALMVQLIADALLEHRGSGNQSFSRARESGELPATTRAAYGKLSRLPITLSVGLLAELTVRLQELFPQQVKQQPPEKLGDFAVVTIDGKTIKRVAKRLKPLRGVSGGVLGGKTVVATELSTGLALAMAADPDGHANDVRLVPQLLPDVRRRLDGPRLWLADRQFCDLVQIERFCEGNDVFVLRYNAKVKFQRDTNEPVREGVDSQGRRFSDECGWLGRDGHPKQRYVRRVTLHRKDGDDITIVTNLFGPRKFPAMQLLDLYLKRWGIEQMFQKVTEVFGLEHLIGGSAQATVFQFAFCLLLYNQIQLIRAYVAKHQDRESESISLEQLFTDVRRELIAWTVVVPAAVTARAIPQRTAAETRRRLDRLLRAQWSDRWIKAVNKKPRPHQSRPTTKTHTSVYRALKDAKRMT